MLPPHAVAVSLFPRSSFLSQRLDKGLQHESCRPVFGSVTSHFCCRIHAACPPTSCPRPRPSVSMAPARSQQGPSYLHSSACSTPGVGTIQPSFASQKSGRRPHAVKHSRRYPGSLSSQRTKRTQTGKMWRFHSTLSEHWFICSFIFVTRAYKIDVDFSTYVCLCFVWWRGTSMNKLCFRPRSKKNKNSTRLPCLFLSDNILSPWRCCGPWRNRVLFRYQPCPCLRPYVSVIPVSKSHLQHARLVVYRTLSSSDTFPLMFGCFLAP